jgi:hypothetical protein
MAYTMSGVLRRRRREPLCARLIPTGYGQLRLLSQAKPSKPEVAQLDFVVVREKHLVRPRILSR